MYIQEFNLFGIFLLTVTMLLIYRNIKQHRLLDAYGEVKAPRAGTATATILQSIQTLRGVHNIHQLAQLTQMHFKTTFNIAYTKVRLYIRPVTESESVTTNKVDGQSQFIIDHVEEYLRTLRHKKNDQELIAEVSKLHDRHELEFDLHYEDNHKKNRYVELLQEIESDLFIPITYEDDVVGYITVDAHGKQKRVYNNVEHEQMLIFADNLATTVHRLRTQPTSKMIQQRKELADNLSQSFNFNQLQQKIITSLENTHHDNSAGIIFCKSKGFAYGNTIAEKLCGANLSNLRLPLVQCIGEMAASLKKYKQCEARSIRNDRSELLTFTGILQSSDLAIITVTRTTVNAQLAQYKESLERDDDWYYALALDNTEAGKEISYLYPPTNERFLPFKVKLLKDALSQYPLLLELPAVDIKAIVGAVAMFHKTRITKTFDAQKQASAHEAACLLFGVPKEFRTHSTPRALLDELNEGGVLLFKNIDCLDAANQRRIFEFLTTGMYTPIQGKVSVQSGARLIFTVQSPLSHEANKSPLNPDLHKLLSKHRLALPELDTVDPEEQAFIIKAIDECRINEYEQYSLSDTHRKQLMESMPASMITLRSEIQQLKRDNPPKLEEYSQKFVGALQEQTVKEHSLEILRNKESAQEIWNELQSATLIEARLGVARSTVNRHLGLHGIIKVKIKDTEQD